MTYRLFRRQADPAAPVSVSMILALFRIKFYGPGKSLSRLQGADNRRIGNLSFKDIRLSPELSGRMGVRIRDEGNAYRGTKASSSLPDQTRVLSPGPGYEGSVRQNILQVNQNLRPLRKQKNAGSRYARVSALLQAILRAIIFRSSFASRPSMGLPSAERFPIFDSLLFILSASSNAGAITRQWTFLVLSFLR